MEEPQDMAACPPQNTWPIVPQYEYPPPVPNATYDMHQDYPSPVGQDSSFGFIPPFLGQTSVIVQYDFELGSWVGSPSILKTKDGLYISSFDVKLISDSYQPHAWETQIWTSADGGRSWLQRAHIRVKCYYMWIGEHQIMGDLI